VQELARGDDFLNVWYGQSERGDLPSEANRAKGNYYYLDWAKEKKYTCAKHGKKYP
jgi:PmbA protein